MKFKGKIYFLALVSVIILGFSCKTDHEKTSNKTITKTYGYPVIKFDTTFHHFGSLIQGEQAAFTFKYKNTGTANLIIKDAFSTCGCTVPEYSKEPVPPGGEGKIEVIFNSEGKKGLQFKTVTLKLNTEKKEKTLVIRANVLENNYKS